MPTKKLAPREAEVLTLLACGNSRDEISLILSLRNTTVRECTCVCLRAGGLRRDAAEGWTTGDTDTRTVLL
ncbi:LuxR C-terminal-related transcriptional regulator [Bradyrhizobium lablabi]|uniref:LuxR C-terminal-related transcriptional regulator n=1 Tax=Bradyrhizobium lablabi TaxID=722472 RepID=UPI003D9AE6DE